MLHRRANLIRTRGVTFLSLKKINDFWAEVEIGTEAGAYIKEFVTSDFGRTRPSLGDLLAGDEGGGGGGVGWKCDILQLDVVGIEE